MSERRSIVEVDDDSSTTLIKHDVARGNVVVRYSERVKMIDGSEDTVQHKGIIEWWLPSWTKFRGKRRVIKKAIVS